MPRSVRALAALTASALAAALVLARPAAGADPAAWFPLEAGRRLTYRTHRDLSLAPQGRALERRFLHGRSERELAPAPEDGARAVALRARHVEWDAERSMPGQRDSTRTRTTVYERTERGIVMLREENESSVEGEAATRVRYTPPVLVLPADAAPGVSWTLDGVRQGELTLDLRARVTGVEDVSTDAGPYRDCLVVRYEGTLSGKMQMGAEPFDVGGGRYLRTVWLARGIGIVREDTELELRLLDRDGKEVRTSQELRETLQSVGAPAGTK
jgi:hypothetical protein